MKTCLVFISAIFSAASAKPLPDDGSDQSIDQEIPQVPNLLAAAPSEGIDSIFTTNWPPSNYQSSNAADLSAGLSNAYPPSSVGDPSSVLLGSLIPINFVVDKPTTAATGELVSETLYQSDPPCVNGFWAACCNRNKLCIWSMGARLIWDQCKYLRSWHCCRDRDNDEQICKSAATQVLASYQRSSDRNPLCCGPPTRWG